jgi:putative addiction module component (TIGR02574 family)
VSAAYRPLAWLAVAVAVWFGSIGIAAAQQAGQHVRPRHGLAPEYTPGDTVGMNRRLTPDDIRALSVEERLQLIEELWNSLDDADSGALPLPDWHREVVSERLAAYERDPGAGRPWDEVKGEILSHLRK